MDATVKPITGPHHPLVGSFVRYADPLGVKHNALVTAVWGVDPDNNPTSVNLVFVSKDPNKTDPNGRQIGRQSSVVIKKLQPAHGMYFELVD